MARRMPVLRHHDIGEALCDPVDHRDDLLAVFNGQAAAGQETVLDIDHQQAEASSILIEAAAQACLEMTAALAVEARPARMRLRFGMLHLLVKAKPANPFAK